MDQKAWDFPLYVMLVCLQCWFKVFLYMTTYVKDIKNYIISFWFYFVPSCLLTSIRLPEAGAVCTVKSWQEKESDSLSMKSMVSFELETQCVKLFVLFV